MIKEECSAIHHIILGAYIIGYTFSHLKKVNFFPWENSPRLRNSTVVDQGMYTKKVKTAIQRVLQITSSIWNSICTHSDTYILLCLFVLAGLYLLEVSKDYAYR